MNHERFYRSVDVLIKAFFQDNLKHGKPCSCAVGNLIKAGGAKPSMLWYRLVRQYISEKERPLAVEQLRCVPYNLKEINLIELAFEYTDDVFSSLCVTFDQLYDLENWQDEEKKVNLLDLATLKEPLMAIN